MGISTSENEGLLQSDQFEDSRKRNQVPGNKSLLSNETKSKSSHGRLHVKPNLRDRVLYRGLHGMVSFVGEEYCVLDLRTHPGRDYPRLLVYPENYHLIQQVRKDD